MSGSRKVFAPLGSSSHSESARETDDYYATPPAAVEMLLELEQFAPLIWEPACGGGHISRVLQAHGYEVISSDIVYRGFGNPESTDFLTADFPDFSGDIVINPPYSYALEFARKAMEMVRPGGRVAMFLKLQFLEGKKRGAFFEKTPPKLVYVSRSRLLCGKNGDFTSSQGSAVAYAWYIWEKGFTGEPVIRWFN